MKCIILAGGYGKQPVAFVQRKLSEAVYGYKNEPFSFSGEHCEKYTVLR